MSRIYLDYAAATPLRREIREAMEPYQRGYYHNPSAIYLAGRAVRRELENARSEVARTLGVKSSEIIFTSGASEANNLAIQGVMRLHPEAGLLLSPIEHDSVLQPAKLFKYQQLKVNSGGIVNAANLVEAIDDETVLISVAMVSNELGSLQPIREIADCLGAIRRDRQKRGVKLPLLLHTDAAQAGNLFDLNTSRLGVDLMTINGGKLYGPKQSGVLYVKAGTKLAPLILGGGQEFGLRAGTESLPTAAGFAKALTLAQESRKPEHNRMASLKELFATELQKSFPPSVINSPPKHSSPHILSVTFPGIDNERMLMELDEAGIEVGMGSACSASSEELSHTLSAIGLSNQAIRSTLRFSFGKPTTAEDLQTVLKSLARTPSLRP